MNFDVVGAVTVQVEPVHAETRPPCRDCRTRTPWGPSDFAYTYGPGVINYSTPSHGGFHLSATRNAQVHDAWREADGWYEEDCDWAKVALTFPEMFTAADVASAHRSAKDWNPDGYQAAFDLVLDPADSFKLTERAFFAAHAGDMLGCAAWGHWHETVPAGKVGVMARVGGRAVNGAQSWWLVDETAYDHRDTNGYVIDPTVDIPWEPHA